MFRAVESGFPPDASYPADLEKLGYFVNKDGQLRSIEHPDKEFQFHWTNDGRHNEVRNEAFKKCELREIYSRLELLGIHMLYLPQLTTTKPDGPHVPILATPADVLKTRKRVFVIVSDEQSDLGVLAYRQLQRDRGINGGSIINFVKEIIYRSALLNFDIFEDRVGVDDKVKDAPGMIVLNTAQLLYSHRYNQALSLRSWEALPRKSVSHERVQIDEVENRVEGMRSEQEHIKFVLDNIVYSSNFVALDAEIYIVGLENGGYNLLQVINKDVEKYVSRIAAMALILPSMSAWQYDNPLLKNFLHQRARQWVVWESGAGEPTDCVQLPEPYHCQHNDGDIVHESSHSPQAVRPSVESIDWTESSDLAARTDSAITSLLKGLVVSDGSQAVAPAAEAQADGSSYDERRHVLCPTFSSGANVIGETIFTDPAVQAAILDFFTEVARDARGYQNPLFNITLLPPASVELIEDPEGGAELEAEAAAAQPGDELGEGERDVSFDPLTVTQEQIQMDALKSNLEHMRTSLAATPSENAVLAPGRAGLDARIKKMEVDLEELTKKALGSGSLGAGQAEELRNKENWTPVGKGPKIDFAGAMVDSELVKAAGMFEIAKQAEKELDSGNED